MYYLLDLGFNLSYMPPNMAIHFNLGPECMSDPLSMSTLVGDSNMTRRVYRVMGYLSVVGKP